MLLGKTNGGGGVRKGSKKGMPHELGFGVREDKASKVIEDVTFKGSLPQWEIKLSALMWGSKHYLFENLLSLLPRKQL